MSSGIPSETARAQAAAESDINHTTTPTSKGDLPSREATAEEKKVIDDILKLYCLEPSEQAYSHYAENAVFHDPVSIAKGKESIMSQFNGMPKVFAKSETRRCDVLQSSTPSSLQLNLTQFYVFKSPIPGKSEGTEKEVNSRITLKLNSNGQIEEHDEEWDHKGNKTEEDGFVGKVQQARKKMDAKLVEMGVSSDPSKA